MSAFRLDDGLSIFDDEITSTPIEEDGIVVGTTIERRSRNGSAYQIAAVSVDLDGGRVTISDGGEPIRFNVDALEAMIEALQGVRDLVEDAG